MFNIFLKIFQTLLQMLKIPLILLAVVILLFIIMTLLHMLILTAKGEKRKPGIRIRQKKRSLLLRLFWDAPKQFVRDMYDMEPDYFRYQGFIVYTGRQGAGKTVAAVHHAMSMQKEYPNAKCISNLDYEYQDDKLDHWIKLIDYKNGHKGVIVLMDETQNWFGSNMSRNFPGEMFSIITQNRKNRRIILGTAQSFNLLAKTLRTQATEVRSCLTLAGCVTIVVRREPFLDDKGDVVKWKYRGMYMFVHDAVLRKCYDTYEVIESLAKSGFQEKLFLERE